MEIAAGPKEPLLSIIKGGLLGDNLPKAAALIVSIINRLETNDTTKSIANPDMLEMAHKAQSYVTEDIKAFLPARTAATELSTIVDGIKEDTKARQKSHQDMQGLATGTD